MARSSSQKPGRILLRRLAWGAGAVAVLFFTIEGGEYGTRDLWSQKGRMARLDGEVEQLKLEVDSLRRELAALTTDDARLERLAREEFGMVKGSKELLYLVGSGKRPPTDSASAAGATDSSESRAR